MRQKTTLFALFLAAAVPLASGRVLSASDDMVKTIKSALVEKLGTDAQTIQVAFYDGKAVLSGKVAEDPTQELAKEVALWVPGVKSVENQVEAANERSVGGGKILAESDDASLEQSVKTALHSEVGKYSSDIEVEACNGVVAVRGTVPDASRHDLAISATTKVHNVKKVIDLLRVPG